MQPLVFIIDSCAAPPVASFVPPAEEKLFLRVSILSYVMGGSRTCLAESAAEPSVFSRLGWPMNSVTSGLLDASE